MGASILAGRDRMDLDNGMSLRLLSALEVLQARREAEELAQSERERALCSNACLLSRALELCALTDGALDLTAYSAVQAWGFTTGEYRVPSQGELDALIPRIDYTRLELDGDGLRARLPENMELDLGAVAKGYAGTYLAEQLRQAGVTSAILRLGGNIQAVGTRPDGNPWRVAIQDPDSQQEATLGVVEIADQAVITSGGYQRYFEEGGETYWHIMDPDTAAPARSGLTSVTVIGADGTVCDALSTALFVMGPEEAAGFWRAHPELGVELILVLEDGAVQITQGLEETFTLSQDRTMEVIAP